MFPNSLKQAQVIPIFKKKDPLDKQNYRPVSILPTISKLYERTIHDQLTEFFNNVFSPFLAAFKKGFGCQTTLLRLIEDWKTALDQHKSVAAILMDLSKAFDCLPHELLLAKFKAYGLTGGGAIELLGSYLRDRQQRIKIGPHTSAWEDLIKGVPQGSILGPLMFNVFINDIFYFIQDSTLYNYADDNTLSYTHSDCTVLKSVLLHCNLFKCSYMYQNQTQNVDIRISIFSYHSQKVEIFIVTFGQIPRLFAFSCRRYS